jgi:hypothetical protein
VDLLDRSLENYLNGVEIRSASQAGKLLQSVLSSKGKAIQLPNHKVHYVIGVILRLNEIQVPSPSRFALIELEETFLGKGGYKLDGEKRIAGCLLVGQLR